MIDRLRGIPFFAWVWLSGVALILIGVGFHFTHVAGAGVLQDAGWTVIIAMFMWAMLAGPSR